MIGYIVHWPHSICLHQSHKRIYSFRLIICYVSHNYNGNSISFASVQMIYHILLLLLPTAKDASNGIVVCLSVNQQYFVRAKISIWSEIIAVLMFVLAFSLPKEQCGIPGCWLQSETKSIWWFEHSTLYSTNKRTIRIERLYDVWCGVFRICNFLGQVDSQLAWMLSCNSSKHNRLKYSIWAYTYIV